MSAYSESVALRASVALGSQPEASSAKSIPRILGGTVLQGRTNDARWSSSSRWRRSEGGSSKGSGVTFVASERDVNGKSDSATGVTSIYTSCCAKASKGTRKSGDNAVPKMSPGSRSLYPVRGIVCRPEPTKCSEGSWPS